MPRTAGGAKQIPAIQYCIDNNIKVSNNSWSLGIHCQSLYDVIKAARDQIGHIVVASAGNLNRNNDSIPHYPSNYGWTHEYAGETIVGLDNVIAVAGTDNDDNLFSSDAGASNYGANSVHLAAPGFNIWTTRLSRTASEYGYFQATSEAAPAVVKAAAPDHRVRGHCKRACRPGGAVRT